MLPANEHDFRLGSTPTGQEKFNGEFGRASIFPAALPEVEVKKLAALSRDQGVTTDVRPVITTTMADSEGRKGFPKTAGLQFSEGLTIEAWVNPTVTPNGRVWDKITPGSAMVCRWICTLAYGSFAEKPVMADAHRLPASGHTLHARQTSRPEIRIYLDGEPQVEKRRRCHVSRINRVDRCLGHRCEHSDKS